MAKRIFPLFLTLALWLSLIPLTATQANAQYTLITDRAAVDGSDYTDSPALAEKLNDIFDGNAEIYRDLACTVPVDTMLGTSPVRNNGVYMFVDPVDGIAKNIGTSCWIYANGVYYTLFGESTGNGIGENSEKLSLSGTGSRTLSYKNLKAWGVRPGVGALIRASGHSMILLGYNEDTLTILDGNSDGRGLVSISETSWDRVGSYVEYIIQPKEAHYSALYACGMCGEDVFWSVDQEGTLTISGTGKISHPAWSEYNGHIKKVVISGAAIEMGNGAFYNCKNLEEIVFRDAAPVLSESTFLGVNANILYPAAKYGWTEDVLLDYGGSPTWVPYGMTELKIAAQPTVTDPQSGAAAEVSICAEGDGLAYSWYTKNAGEDLYVKSSFTGPVYCAMTGEDQQVVCVVTDQYGNFLISDPVRLAPGLSAI